LAAGFSGLLGFAVFAAVFFAIGFADVLIDVLAAVLAAGFAADFDVVAATAFDFVGANFAGGVFTVGGTGGAGGGTMGRAIVR